MENDQACTEIIVLKKIRWENDKMFSYAASWKHIWMYNRKQVECTNGRHWDPVSLRDRTRGSSDSEKEEEEEAQREWRDEGEIWNQLGDWAGVACIVVGVSQAEKAKEGTRVWVLCHECMHLYKQKLSKVTTVYDWLVNIWWHTKLAMWAFCCSRKSSKKWSSRGQNGGSNSQLAPTQAMSTQQLSIFPYTPSPRYFFAHQIHSAFVFYGWLWRLGNLTWRKKKKNKAQTETLWACF